MFGDAESFDEVSGENPFGVELLTDESEAQYRARQSQLKSDAEARMREKFGSAGLATECLADTDFSATGSDSPDGAAELTTRQPTIVEATDT